MNPGHANAVRAPRAPWLGLAAIIIAVVIAYANSLGGVFVLDDLGSIRGNPTIRHLATALFPPSGGLTVSGRPLLNLSFALNYAVGGDSARGYHVVNLVIHLFASLTLFGLVRRTLRLPSVAAGIGAGADSLALVIALLWALHPLQTESVTYLAQRAESLAGLFFLLTFYCFLRGAEPHSSARWFDASIVACVLGALTKETLVAAPVLVVLYDRTFLSRSIEEAWDRRRSVYCGLALSWLIVCWLLVGTGSRGGTAGLATTMAWRDYALKQFHAIGLYLKLAFWPRPLVLDYGTSVDVTVFQLATGIVVVGTLLIATLVSLRRRPALGFLGAWFFLILAPTSSVVPVASQVMAEHRMYLPLAAVVALAVLSAYRWTGRRAVWVGLALAAVCGVLTVQRNRDYGSWVTLWTQALDYGENFRAELNLGQALAETGHPEEAIVHYTAALRIQPQDHAAHNNLANALVDLNRLDEACRHFEEALRFKPTYAEGHFNYANTLVRLGRPADAVGHYRTAVRLAPDHALAYYNLANALTQLNRLAEAVEAYETAVRLAPGNANAHLRLGNTLMQLGRAGQAVGEYEATLRLDPQNADAARNLDLARQAASKR
jgi:Flp pilus assembly protein TadD